MRVNWGLDSQIYCLADLDRSNLGNARLQGLPADVLHGDKSGKQFDWINSAFFFSYVHVSLFQSSVVIHRLSDYISSTRDDRFKTIPSPIVDGCRCFWMGTIVDHDGKFLSDTSRNLLLICNDVGNRL